MHLLQRSIPFFLLAFLLILLAILLTYPQTSAADSLRHVMRSNLMDRVEEGSKKFHDNFEREGIPYLDRTTNFGRIFNFQEGPRQTVFEWLLSGVENYTLRQFVAKKRREYVEASAKLDDEVHSDVYRLRLLVPHPKYVEMIEYGALVPFLKLRPIPSRVEKKENVKLASFDAELYHLKNGSCTLLVPLPRNTYIDLRVLKCTSAEPLVSFAKRLNWFRLGEKLRS